MADHQVVPQHFAALVCQSLNIENPQTLINSFEKTAKSEPADAHIKSSVPAYPTLDLPVAEDASSSEIEIAYHQQLVDTALRLQIDGGLPLDFRLKMCAILCEMHVFIDFSKPYNADALLEMISNLCVRLNYPRREPPNLGWSAKDIADWEDGEDQNEEQARQSFMSMFAEQIAAYYGLVTDLREDWAARHTAGAAIQVAPYLESKMHSSPSEHPGPSFVAINKQTKTSIAPTASKYQLPKDDKKLKRKAAEHLDAPPSKVAKAVKPNKTTAKSTGAMKTQTTTRKSSQRGVRRPHVFYQEIDLVEATTDEAAANGDQDDGDSSDAATERKLKSSDISEESDLRNVHQNQIEFNNDTHNNTTRKPAKFTKTKTFGNTSDRRRSTTHKPLMTAAQKAARAAKAAERKASSKRRMIDFIEKAENPGLILIHTTDRVEYFVVIPGDKSGDKTLDASAYAAACPQPRVDGELAKNADKDPEWTGDRPYYSIKSRFITPPGTSVEIDQDTYRELHFRNIAHPEYLILRRVDAPDWDFIKTGGKAGKKAHADYNKGHQQDIRRLIGGGSEKRGWEEDGPWLVTYIEANGGYAHWRNVSIKGDEMDLVMLTHAEKGFDAVRTRTGMHANIRRVCKKALGENVTKDESEDEEG